MTSHNQNAGTIKCTGLFLSYGIYGVYMRHKRISCFVLGLIPKISHYADVNLPKPETQTFTVLGISSRSPQPIFRII